MRFPAIQQLTADPFGSAVSVSLGTTRHSYLQDWLREAGF